MTYRWNEDGTDAELLEEGAEASYDVIDEEGVLTTVNWVFPSRQQCLTCHNANAGYVLGPEMRNLNKGIHYTKEAPLTNQLRTWQNLGVLEQDLELSVYNPLSALDDEHASNEEKVRSYLQSNCSFCHRPGGVETKFNAMLTTLLDSANLVGAATVGRQSMEESSVIAPGDILHSEMVRRIESVDGLRMPLLRRSVVDQEFVTTLESWILELGLVTSASHASSENQRYWIYPNPTSGHELSIQSKHPNHAHSFIINNLSGSEVQTFDQVTLEQLFTVRLDPGVYSIRITDGEEVFTLKRVKKRG